MKWWKNTYAHRSDAKEHQDICSYRTQRYGIVHACNLQRRWRGFARQGFVIRTGFVWGWFVIHSKQDETEGSAYKSLNAYKLSWSQRAIPTQRRSDGKKSLQLTHTKIWDCPRVSSSTPTDRVGIVRETLTGWTGLVWQVGIIRGGTPTYTSCTQRILDSVFTY